MATVWSEVLVLPVGSPPGARMVKAQPDDGGELRAGVAAGEGGVKVLEIGYQAEIPPDEPASTEREHLEALGDAVNGLARWPTLEEIYSAMDALLEPGAMVTLTLIRGQDREGPVKVLTLTQVGKVVPRIDGIDGGKLQ